MADDLEECLFQIFVAARNFGDRANGLEFALVHDGDAVADGFDFAEFVRGKENGFAVVLQALDDLANFHAAKRVEAAGGFIEHEQIGIVDECLREAGALLHAFGIRFDGAIRRVFQFDKFQTVLEKASQAVGRLDGLAAVLPDTEMFLYMYVRKEALLSSQIEGTQSSLSDLLLFML